MRHAYPTVLSEFETLAGIEHGASVARYGDGEFKIATGRGIKSQEWAPDLQAELLAILRRPDNLHCTVAIPNIGSIVTGRGPRTPKHRFWRTYLEPRYLALLDHGGTYGSSFITRPDSAPWIDGEGYWRRIRELWERRTVWIVGGSQKGWRAHELEGARDVRTITAPRQHAWAFNRDLFATLRLADPEVLILLSLGPTATVLAYRLAQEGRWALDLGHLPMFLRHKTDPTVDLKASD